MRLTTQQKTKKKKKNERERLTSFDPDTSSSKVIR